MLKHSAQGYPTRNLDANTTDDYELFTRELGCSISKECLFFPGEDVKKPVFQTQNLEDLYLKLNAFVICVQKGLTLKNYTRSHVLGNTRYEPVVKTLAQVIGNVVNYFIVDRIEIEFSSKNLLSIFLVNLREMISQIEFEMKDRKAVISIMNLTNNFRGFYDLRNDIMNNPKNQFGELFHANRTPLMPLDLEEEAIRILICQNSVTFWDGILYPEGTETQELSKFSVTLHRVRSPLRTKSAMKITPAA